MKIKTLKKLQPNLNSSKLAILHAQTLLFTYLYRTFEYLQRSYSSPLQPCSKLIQIHHSNYVKIIPLIYMSEMLRNYSWRNSIFENVAIFYILTYKSDTAASDVSFGKLVV